MGSEYQILNNYFKNCGIQHCLACPYIYEQMDFVERQHCQIVEMGSALLAHSNLSKPYWEDAFPTTAYIINCLPSKALNNKPPFEMAYHHKPNYLFM